MTVITAGDPVTGVWCPVCLTDSRLRIELFADGEPAGGLEICPGCGTGHDKPGAYITGQPDAAESPPPRGPGHLSRLLASLRPSGPACDRDHCGRASRNIVHDWTDGAGTRIAYRFCSKRHRQAWREENGL